MKKWLLMFIFILEINGGAIAQGIPKTAYVLNSLGQNLSLINLQNESVTIDALPLGLYANAIKIRNEKAYSVNSGINEVQVISLNPLGTVDHIDVGNSTNPWSMDFVNDSIAAVSLLFTNQVAIVNVNSGQVIQNVPVGVSPEGIKYYNGKIYVANSGFNGAGFDPGTVSVIDVLTFTVTDTLSVGVNPQDLDVDSQGRLVVVCTGDYSTVNGEMDIVNLNNGDVVLSVPFSSGITTVRINAQDQCYVGTSGSGLMVYNLISQSFERTESNPLPGGPGIDFDAQNNVYTTDFSEDSVRVFSPSHQKIAAYLVGDGPASICIYDPSVTNIELTNPAKPDNFILYQNYPNPFNPSTAIKYDLSEISLVHLDVFNLLGEKVRTLINEKQLQGSYSIEWNGRNDNGRIIPSGVYFYRLKIGDQYKIRQMRLIK
jgi:hypothetical protein